MSTTQEQIALLNLEKEENIAAIASLEALVINNNLQINNLNNNLQFANEQIVNYNADIAKILNDNAIIDDIITTLQS